MRSLKYREALSEGLVQAMESDPDIFVTGIGVDYSSAIFGSTAEALKRFPDRVFESPAMENALTGIAIGAAAMGKRPVIIHARNDFMFLALDQLINLASKWRYMYGGNAGSVPVVTRAIVGKGWGQGATHSQSLHATLAHFPGLNVVCPATPHDAKGLTIAALRSDKPTVIIEHRALYETEGEVYEHDYALPFGDAFKERAGTDLTIVAVSQMVTEALLAAKELEAHGISAEVINLRSIRPLDEDAILYSVEKTQRLIVADTSWELCGIASEVVALVAEKTALPLKAAPKRISLANCPCPVSQPLEDAFYPKASTIANAALAMMGLRHKISIDTTDNFKGPY